MGKWKRVFLVVADSMGIGGAKDQGKFGDEGASTLEHALASVGGIHLPILEGMGLGCLSAMPGNSPRIERDTLAMALNERSAGKDTMTGHWEMMGIETKVPFQTFTDTGFPKELIEALEKETGHKVIGNKAASGTEILVELGERQMKENSLIVYTSADSVLQIAAHEEVTGLEELYRCCEIARELTMRPEWFVGRVIARPYLGSKEKGYVRTEHRKDYTVPPPMDTVLDVLMKEGFLTSGIGKIGDIFDMKGLRESDHTGNNRAGMASLRKAIETRREEEGLWFVNLVDFDSLYGHRRNAPGYARCIQELDEELGRTLPLLGEGDLLMLTADHGNDPVHKGTDHTRERVPLLIRGKGLGEGRVLPERSSFGDIGATMLENFGIRMPSSLIGESIKEAL